VNGLMKNSWETIISVGAEGGSITLYGKELEPEQWIFRKSVNEIDFDDDFDELQQTSDDVKEIRTVTSTIVNRGNDTDSWEKALEIMNQFPWPLLRPREVHPKFRQRVWNAVNIRLKNSPEDSWEHDRLYHWARVCIPEYLNLADWLRHASHVTVLTGAGMSTESNIPDFRSRDGWWNNIDPRTVATTDALENNYDLFHEFYSMRIHGLETCAPHRGHQILADWERKRLIKAVATQNVDGFHTLAGNHNVYELHGSIHKIRCATCSKPISKEEFLKKESCHHCGGKLRPSVVLFGESLPQDQWNASVAHIRQSDLVIVIGTSLEVYPVSSLPQMTSGKTVYINAEVGSNARNFDLFIQG
jgi:NAD-dependent SIR2 family protein deacetylase